MQQLFNSVFAGFLQEYKGHYTEKIKQRNSCGIFLRKTTSQNNTAV